MYVWREGGREGEREGGREGERDGGREGGREGREGGEWEGYGGVCVWLGEGEGGSGEIVRKRGIGRKERGGREG